MRGLNDGEYQLVPPWLPGYVGWPGGCGVWIGRPRSSNSLIQLTFTNGRAEQEPSRSHDPARRSCRCDWPTRHVDAGAAPVVDQHRDLHRVVVVDVVRRELVVPSKRARVGVERDHRGGVEVVARPLRAGVIGTDIAHAPVGEIELRIVGAGQPDRSAAVLPGLGIAERRRTWADTLPTSRGPSRRVREWCRSATLPFRCRAS